MILLVEDDVSIRSAMSDLLSSEGYEIVEAGNGQEALTALLKMGGETPCVILLDLLMPVMDGHRFLRELQNNVQFNSKRIPIVITSAMAGAAEDAKALPFVSKTLRKPFNVTDVLDTIQEFCG